MYQRQAKPETGVFYETRLEIQSVIGSGIRGLVHLEARFTRDSVPTEVQSIA
jgi:hypothetical protein